MQTLPPDYLAEIARQIAFLSAFLGGFAATFLATLLVAGSPRRVAGWAIGGAAVAAGSFIIAIVAAVMLTIVSHPEVPPNVLAGSSVLRARLISTLGFFIGLLALLASLGLSGWIRSRKTGIATTVAASLATAMVLWAALGFR